MPTKFSISFLNPAVIRTYWIISIQNDLLAANIDHNLLAWSFTLELVVFGVQVLQKILAAKYYVN